MRTGAARWAPACAGATLIVAMSALAAQDLVRVPGGTARIGSDRGRADERPAFVVAVPAFDLERSPVTVAQFARFVRAQRYVTEAERRGASGVMTFGTGQWRLVEGASWRKPEGPLGPDAEPDHPVTHVSWHDAAAYCAAAGRRLPTEIEWEHAARSGQPDGGEFPFGGALARDGRWRANVWTGAFPAVNTAEDGYRTTSPVGAFGRGPLGLTDMAGNVWEWTADWYRPYAERGQPWDGRAGGEKAQRGGSFLCDAQMCSGFRLAARGHATPDSSHMHVGFRCAKSVEAAT